MSSSSLVQGLQPCVEPRPAYACKLPRRTDGWLPSVPDPDPVWESNNGDRSSNFPAKGSKGERSGGGWSSFFESMYRPSQIPASDAAAETKSAPAWSSSSSGSSLPRLNQRSLDLCTEILGSETGKGYIIGDKDELRNLLSPPPRRPLPPPFISSSPADPGERKSGIETKPGMRRKVCSPVGLPPPLPSITGGKSVRVVRCREGGRLVLKATTEPSSLFFQAQRTAYRYADDSGRSHLCIRYGNEIFPSTHFPKKYHPISPLRVEEEVEGTEGLEVAEEGEKKSKNGSKKKKKNKKAVAERKVGGEGGEAEEEEIGGYLGIVGKEMESSYGEEVGVEKYWRRPSRCKEGGGGGGGAGGGVCGGGSDGNTTGTVLVNWVATS